MLNQVHLFAGIFPEQQIALLVNPEGEHQKQQQRQGNFPPQHGQTDLKIALHRPRAVHGRGVEHVRGDAVQPGPENQRPGPGVFPEKQAGNGRVAARVAAEGRGVEQLLPQRRNGPGGHQQRQKQHRRGRLAHARVLPQQIRQQKRQRHGSRQQHRRQRSRVLQRLLERGLSPHVDVIVEAHRRLGKAVFQKGINHGHAHGEDINQQKGQHGGKPRHA